MKQPRTWTFTVSVIRRDGTHHEVTFCKRKAIYPERTKTWKLLLKLLGVKSLRTGMVDSISYETEEGIPPVKLYY